MLDPTIDDIRPLYDGIREHTGGDRILYIVPGGGGYTDFEKIEFHYRKDSDTGAYLLLRMNQPQRYTNNDETRISIFQQGALEYLKTHGPDIATAIVFDNSLLSGRSMFGAVYYTLKHPVGKKLERIYVGATRDTIGASNFVLYPTYKNGVNKGPQDFLANMKTTFSKLANDDIMKMEQDVFYEGDIPTIEIDVEELMMREKNAQKRLEEVAVALETMNRYVDVQKGALRLIGEYLTGRSHSKKMVLDALDDVSQLELDFSLFYSVLIRKCRHPEESYHALVFPDNDNGSIVGEMRDVLEEALAMYRGVEDLESRRKLTPDIIPGLVGRMRSSHRKMGKRQRVLIKRMLKKNAI